MCPCNVNDVSFDIPSGPSGPSIPGVGIPFALKLPDINPFPSGFPENLLELLDKLTMLLPPGSLKPALNPNFGKDIFDGIMKLLDQFMPYLMLYKFFLPILKLIICIIEVLCAIKNPFKLIRALKRLFRKCLPDFLNLFPLYALIIMIISLLQLLLALIQYIIEQIQKLIEMILRNLRALYKAIQYANENSILAIAKKLGALLCVFQNLFVLLSIFNIIFDIFRDMLSIVYAIPPCDDTDATNADGCCTPDVCPEIVKEQYVSQSGTLQYFNKISVQTSVPLPGSTPFLTVTSREETWQLYDVSQTIAQAFYNIVDAYDIPQVDNFGNIINTPKPIFFPTDVTYTAQTAPKQAAYTLDIKVYYDAASWGRPYYEAGQPRYIIFKDCIALYMPSRDLLGYDNSTTTITNGVFRIAGGLGYEADGVTKLYGYEADGITRSSVQATLGNFLHKAEVVSINPTPMPTDGYLFTNMEYIFKPNHQILMDKGLITSGCIPDFDIDKSFMTSVMFSGIGVRLAGLKAALDKNNGFPDPNATQECLMAATAALRSNFTFDGVAQFQATTEVCLQKLKDDTNSALGKLVALGFDPCKSNFNLDYRKQFTSKPIIVSVNLNEGNGLPITSNLSAESANEIAAKLKMYATFGDLSTFTYDGYQVFKAEITSKVAGSGSVMISYDDNILCTNTLPDNIDEPPTHTLQEIEYQFVYTPAGTVYPGVSTSVGDTTGQPRRDESDMARDNR